MPPLTGSEAILQLSQGAIVAPERLSATEELKLALDVSTAQAVGELSLFQHLVRHSHTFTSATIAMTVFFFS